jgi:adenosine deaminase
VNVRDWLRSLPKAELHVHLEGTLTPELYALIARRNGDSLPGDPRVLFDCHDFGSFLDSFLKVVKTLRRPEDFGDIAAAYLDKSAEQGVRHVELMFSPATVRYFHEDVDLVEIVAAIHVQCERARVAKRVSSLTIFDMVRNLGEDSAMADIDLALRCRELGVVGIGLGGDERRFPARDFQHAFERGLRLGLRRTAHAGEADGSASVSDAIELLHAERIGHGVAAAGQPQLQRRLRELGITIDACPASNAITGVWDRSMAHPIEEFMQARVPVSLSSDDPGFFGCSLLDEYERLAESGLSKLQLAQIARTSISTSFAEDREKRTWLDELDAYLLRTG